MKPNSWTIVALSLTLIAAFANDASAKSTRRVSHSYERVWPAAVRFLRIDEGLTIVEKDADTGYVVFTLVDDGKEFEGALEVVKRHDNAGRKAVELFLTISHRPKYMEIALLDRLLAKLQTELGLPPRPKPKQKPEAKPKQKPKTTNETP